MKRENFHKGPVILNVFCIPIRKFFQEYYTIRVSNSYDPEQAMSVGPDRGPKLLAEDKDRHLQAKSFKPV